MAVRVAVKLQADVVGTEPQRSRPNVGLGGHRHEVLHGFGIVDGGLPIWVVSVATIGVGAMAGTRFAGLDVYALLRYLAAGAGSLLGMSRSSCEDYRPGSPGACGRFVPRFPSPL